MSENPLRKHFRKPEIFITLPSAGKFWADGSLNLPATGEIPVFSMTAADELYLLTPDALANGDAIVSLIQSCVPNITDAWQTPCTDLETLLVSIRIASVGERLGIESACPKCSETGEYEVDLKELALREDPSIWNQRIVVDNLKYSFRPLNYIMLNQFNQQYFEVRKKIQQIPQVENLDERERITDQLMSEYNHLDLKFMIDSVYSIATADEVVTDRSYIEEFLLNSDKRTYTQIRNHVEKLKDTTKFGDVKLVCDHCQHRYSTNISLDYASFFEISS